MTVTIVKGITATQNEVGNSFDAGTITNSTINSSTIGATTPATGNFTTISANSLNVTGDVRALTGTVLASAANFTAAVSANSLHVNTIVSATGDINTAANLVAGARTVVVSGDSGNVNATGVTTGWTKLTSSVIPSGLNGFNLSTTNTVGLYSNGGLIATFVSGNNSFLSGNGDNTLTIKSGSGNAYAISDSTGGYTGMQGNASGVAKWWIGTRGTNTGGFGVWINDGNTQAIAVAASGQTQFLSNVSAPSVQIVNGSAGLEFLTVVSGQGASTATLTNSPIAGNPSFYLPVRINGAIRVIPCW